MKTKQILSQLALVAITIMTSAAGCSSDKTTDDNGGSGNDNGTTKDKWASLVNETKYDLKVSGSKATYGSHTYEVTGSLPQPGEDVNNDGIYDVEEYLGKTTATVVFSNIPSGYTEFEAVYNGLLGKSIHGTAAMIPMAFEIYARDAATGEKCLNLLCNSSATVTGIVRTLKQKLVPSQYASADDLYIQRFLAAALLKGATPDNAYNPSTPYTVEMGPSVNAPQEVSISGNGTDYFLYIIGKGWDTEQRGVEVFLEKGASLYKVFNCPSTYTQCKNIVGTWQGLK